MSKTIQRYKIIKGLFQGRVFKGSYCAGRVWNEESYGQSYPLENCEVIDDTCTTRK